MKKSLALIFVLIFSTISCGSSQKKAEHAKYRRGGDAQAHYPSRDPLSIDDIIYENLEHKHSGGVHYAEFIQQNDKFDIPYEYNQYVQKWIDYFTGRGREHFARYLSRLGRFMPYIHSVTDRYGLPRDLVYLSMIESGFNIRAQSWASAVGPWQFIRSTGAMYGLTVDYYIDERRDVQKATHAAARHLRDLYNEFGHWYLAFAAYNAGPGKVRNAINRHGTNFWDMVEGRYLRQETKDYVPKILAAALISKNPKKYGFTGVNYQTAVPFETVKMNGATDLEVAAECAGVDPDLVRLLNPELLRDMTPPHMSDYALKIPYGTKSRFEKRYAALRPSERVRTVHYTTQRGDTVKSVASSYGVSPKDLAEANSGKIETNKSRHTKKVKVSYRRKGKTKWRWQKQTQTVVSYDVNPGTNLVIPNNRSLLAYSSSRDDAAAYKAEGQFGKQVAFVEKGSKKKEKKKQQEEVLKVAALPPESDLTEQPAVQQPQEVQESIPVRSDLEEVEGEAVVAEKDNMQRGTPMDLSDESAGAPVAGPVATAPSDAELREAVLRVHPVPNESASDEATADAPTSDETVAASPPEEKKWAVKKPDAISKPSADSKYYQVRPGDTLAQIAKRHGVSAARLKEWNGKKVYPVLQANARIVVRQNQVVKYKVKPGDNLTKIAQKHSTTPAEIQKMNGLKSNVILPGAVLVVQHSK